MDIEYGYDQPNVTCPTLFPTVTFVLEEDDDLIAEADRICGGDSDYEFMIGITGFTKTVLDNCIMFFASDGANAGAYSIVLDETMQKEIYVKLDEQCRKALGKSCEDLLEEARKEME